MANSKHTKTYFISLVIREMQIKNKNFYNNICSSIIANRWKKFQMSNN